MDIPFNKDSLDTPAKLERTLRQFKAALDLLEMRGTAAAKEQTPIDITALAKQVRDQLQATGSAPLNTSLLPATGATGTFTTADAKTVTVVNGIVVSIV